MRVTVTQYHTSEFTIEPPCFAAAWQSGCVRISLCESLEATLTGFEPRVTAITRRKDDSNGTYALHG